ncbi:M28 family metallopeptidase [Haloimpatiens sp. FM7315]|uniref:M28 family metallopeptidase n=1 Tax=Haloimpatiens sp. FM7315 TaxID=3298609 RepID=UPI0035A31535
MKKYKKLFIIIILSFLFLCFFKGLKSYISFYHFDCCKVKSHISYLSSNKLKGRLPGTVGNQLAAQYIKSEFEKTGLKPLEKTYFQKFNIKYPCKIEGETPYLNVLDKDNKIIKSFTYGKEFKEDMLNFKNNSILFNKENSNFSSKGISVTSGNDRFILYKSKDDLNFRSSFMINAPSSMYIMITNNTLNQIKNYVEKGYSIKCYIPYNIKSSSVVNVLSKIEGKSKNLYPIVISAHFDHVGTDLNNNVYNGALDNASGTSFLLELSKYIKSLGTPKRDIIFAAFNGEEFGFLGATAFANKYYNELKNSKVFNFDMIGGKKSCALCLMGAKKDSKSNEFVRSISSACSSEKINFNELFEDSSDHTPFRARNIDAVTFCDYDLSKIHTPKDKVQFIENDSINRCFKIASKEIVKCSFGFNPFINHYKLIMCISGLGIVIILIYCSKSNKK